MSSPDVEDELDTLEKEELIRRLKDSRKKVTQLADDAHITDLFPHMEALEKQLLAEQMKGDALVNKTQNLEAENRSLLSRAMAAEQTNTELQSMKESQDSRQEALEARVAELEKLLSGLQQQETTLKAQLAAKEEKCTRLEEAERSAESERKNAEEHNQLRLKVEKSFNELSKQHEALLRKFDAEHTKDDNWRSAVNAAEIAEAAQRARAETLEKNVLQLTAQLEIQRKELEAATASCEAMRLSEKKRDEELRATKKSLAATQHDLETSKANEEHLQEQLESLKHSTAQWKQDGEKAAAFQKAHADAVSANSALTAEMQKLRAQIKRMNGDMRRMEEEDRKRREESVSTKQAQYLKLQLAELGEKQNALHEREKGWLRERQEMMQEIKKLKWELKHKNPSQLRLMEVEVQNELLLGLLQNRSKFASKPGQSPQPPRKLPPIPEYRRDSNDNVGSSASPQAAVPSRQLDSAPTTPTKASDLLLSSTKQRPLGVNHGAS